MRIRTSAIIVSAIALIAGVTFSPGGVAPAFAAAVGGDANGLTFTADDSNPGLGATVTGLDPTNVSTDVVIPSSVVINNISYQVTNIESGAFNFDNLTSVSIPDTVTTIGGSAFYGDGELTDVSLGQSVTTIGTYAFFGFGATAITIPASVTSIGDYAFEGTVLATVDFEGAAPTTIDDESTGQPFGIASQATNELATINYDAGFGVPGGFSSPVWEGYPSQATATVSYELNGHGTAISPTTVDVGVPVAPPADPSASGYQFGGWYYDAGVMSAVDFSSPVNTDTTYYARWIPTSSTPSLPSGDAMYGISCPDTGTTGQLVSVNAGNGVSTSIGTPSPLIYCGFGAVWDARNSTAYFQNFQLPNGPIETINVHDGRTATGFQPMYQNAPINFFSITVGNNGVLYGTDGPGSPNLYAVDAARDEASLVSLDKDMDLGIIGNDPNANTLYSLSTDGQVLARIDPSSGDVTDLTNSLGLNVGAGFGIQNLEVDSSGEIWVQASDDWSSEIFTIDPSDGYKVTVRPTLTLNGQPLGVTSLLIVPKSALGGSGDLALTGVSINPLAIPTALSILGVGAVLVVVGRIRTRARRRAKARSVAE